MSPIFSARLEKHKVRPWESKPRPAFLFSHCYCLKAKAYHGCLQYDITNITSLRVFKVYNAA